MNYEEIRNSLKYKVGKDIYVDMPVLYLPNIEHLGVHKKNIWKVLHKNANNTCKIENIATGESFTCSTDKLINIRYIENEGCINSNCISRESLAKFQSNGRDDLADAISINKFGSNPYKFGNNFDKAGSIPYKEFDKNKTFAQLYGTESGRTSLNNKTGVEKTKMNTSISGTIDKNTAAAKQAAIVVAGSTLNQLIATKVVKQLPRKYAKLGNHALANVVIANVASFAVQNFAQSNYKARVAADAMMQAAMQDFLKSFNIDQIINEVLASVDIENLMSVGPAE